MTGFFIDLSCPRDRVLIGSDTLAYTVAGKSFQPIGFVQKVIPFPHVNGALFGTGIQEIVARAAVTLLQREDEFDTFAAVRDALPGILRDETVAFATRHGIADSSALMLVAAGWCGFNPDRDQFEAMIVKHDFTMERITAELYGLPNVSPSYMPANFGRLAGEARVAAAMQAIRRFIVDHGRQLGMAPIGGEIELTEIDRDGVSSHVIGRLGDFDETKAAIEATRQRVAASPDEFAGLELVNKVDDRRVQLQVPRAPIPTIAPVGVPLNRADRRRAEKLARKAAARRAA